jgi:hypothetical protein
MSELSKNQLTTENNNSFPNNNTGYITPTLLRTFNQNMIDSLVDEIQYNADSASFNQRINVLDPSGSAAAISALEQATSSLNAYTASQNSFNSSATASIVALQNFSSSLDTTFATDAELSASVSALSASIAVTDLSQSSSIAALQQFSSSLDTTFATDAQLSASASTLQNNINTLSSSVAVTDLAQSQSIAALQQFSSSLDSTFATDAQLSASASTLQNDINTRLLTSSFQSYTQSISTQIAGLGQVIATKLNTASFNSYTQSNDSKVNSLIAQTSSYAQASYVNNLSGAIAETDATQSQQIAALQGVSGSYATTGSNTFIGNQIVSGNVNIAGNITAVSASFTYVTTIFETASVIFSSGSNQFGDELSDVQTLSGSVKVQGELLVNGVPVQTSSFDASGYLLTSSFNTYTQSAASGVSASINSATQSLSSSIAVTTNGLDLEVNQKLDSSSFNAYTESNDIKVNALIAQTGSYAISSSVAATFDAFSSSISLTYATETELSASASTLQNGINSKVENSTFNTYTQSQAAVNAGLTTAIGIRLLTSSFNTYTSSNDSKVNSLIAATGSYITSAQTSSMTVLSASYSETASYALNTQNIDTGSLVTTASFNAYTSSEAANVSASINSATQSLSSSIATTTNNLDLEVNGKLDSSSFNSYTQSNDSVVNALVAATASYVTEAETGSFITSAQTSSMSVLSSSFATTASFALNVTPTDVSPFLSASTFNAYTQSNDSKVNSLIDKTGSFATTGSNTFNGNQIISGNLNISGNITATSASFIYIQTIFETASTIYSSGSNQFGDEASDVQTLYGSVNAVNRFTASGLNYPTADNGDKSFLQTDGNGNLSLQYVDTIFEAFYAVESVPKGTPLYFSGSQGANPRAFAADASDPTKMPVVVIANDNLTAGNTYEGIVLGLIEGIDLTGFTAGQSVYVAEGGGYSISLPSGSNSITQLLGVITKGGAGGKGLVLNPGPAQLPGLQTGYVWVGNTSNQPVAIATSSIQTDVSGYTTTASFNSYTSSNDSKVNSLISATSSYAISSSVASITSASQGQINSLINATSSYITSTGSFATTGSNTFVGNQIITGSVILSSSADIELTVIGNSIISGNLVVTGSNINLEVDAPALSVGVTNVKTIADASASGVPSTLDITRLGAGPTGDLSGIRLQTLSGSDTTGDTLLSRINTGVNRHTSTGIVGSVVNSTITSTWATGSGAGRSAFSTTINANAQSASATLTLNAGNASQNFAGGTASFNSGFIRIGSAQAHRVEVTGSVRIVGNTNISGSLNVSSSLTDDNGNFINGGVTIVGATNGNAIAIKSGSFALTTPQGSGSFYSNCPITSSGLRINGVALVNDLIISGVFSGNSTLQVLGNASVTQSLWVGNAITASVISASQYIGITNVDTSSLATTGSNIFKGNQTISGSTVLSGSVAISGSNPTIQSGSLSGSLISNLGDIYTGSNNANFIVTLGSASMAFLISSSTVNPNTLYFVI